MIFKNPHKKNLLRIVSLILCLFFLWQVVDKALYTHTHINENGEIVIHAHPYNKKSDSGPLKKHHHSKFEFVILSHLVLLYSLFSFFLISLVYKLFFLLRTENRIWHTRSVINNCLGRAPPVA